jgi:hypothetical protein
MPYEIELERDFDSGLDRYVITVEDGFDARDADELGEWMTAAAQNPTAAFTVDATHVGTGRRAPLERLFARIARLRERVQVVRRGVAAKGPMVIGLAGGLPVFG